MSFSLVVPGVKTNPPNKLTPSPSPNAETPPAPPGSRGSVDAFQTALQDADDATLMQPWQLRNGENVLFEAPCVAAIRGFVLNHVVRHRGQISV